MAATDSVAGQTFIERFMQDTCTVYREPAEQYGDTLDPATGLLVDLSGDDSIIYRGKVIVKKPRTDDRPMVIGGEPTDAPMHKMLFPLSVTGIRIDDIIVVNSSVNDNALKGTRYRVKGVLTGTYPVYRAVFAQDITHAR